MSERARSSPGDAGCAAVGTAAAVMPTASSPAHTAPVREVRTDVMDPPCVYRRALVSVPFAIADAMRGRHDAHRQRWRNDAPRGRRPAKIAAVQAPGRRRAPPGRPG